MQTTSPPTLVATLQGDRGLLTVLDETVVWQSMATAQRWQRSGLSVQVAETAVTIGDVSGYYSFDIESGDAHSVFGLQHVPAPPTPTPPPPPPPAAPVFDDGLDSSTVASVARSEPAAVAAPVLTLVFDDHTVPLASAHYVVGRQPDPRPGAATVTLEDRTVSRNHATLVVEADRVLVTDLGSSNGTFVEGDDGAEISLTAEVAVPVPIGSRIGFGDAWCRLEVG